MEKKSIKPSMCDICRHEIDGKDYHMIEKSVRWHIGSEYRFPVAVCIECCKRILRCEGSVS